MDTNLDDRFICVPAFLNWVAQDILEEEHDMLEEMGLDWKTDKIDRAIKNASVVFINQSLEALKLRKKGGQNVEVKATPPSANTDSAKAVVVRRVPLPVVTALFGVFTVIFAYLLGFKW